MLGNSTFSQLPYSTVDSSLKTFNGEVYDIILETQQKQILILKIKPSDLTNLCLKKFINTIPEHVF